MSDEDLAEKFEAVASSVDILARSMEENKKELNASIANINKKLDLLITASGGEKNSGSE